MDTLRANNEKAALKAAKQRAKLESVLDAAAAEVNARGISGAVLGHIAKRVGLTRAALYYYFDSREELAFQCYLRSCEITAGDLDEAERSGNTGLEQVLAFILRALDAQRSPIAVLSEIPYLGPTRGSQVEAAHRANVQGLQQFIERGIGDGSIRHCDSEIVCQAIVGMLAWVPLTSMWFEDEYGDIRQQAADALCLLIQEGVAEDRESPVECPLSVEQFAFQPSNAFDRNQSRLVKIEQLTGTASGHFNRRGIDGTSLDDITAALGATKGAFYHYFADKQSLVTHCFQRAYDLYERFVDAAESTGRNGREKIVIGLHLNIQAQVSTLSPLSPLSGSGIEALPAKVRRELRQRSEQIERRFQNLGQQGVSDGSLRPYDVRTIAFAGAGAFGWIPKWRQSDDPRSPRAVADEMTTLFMIGLRQP